MAVLIVLLQMILGVVFLVAGIGKIMGARAYVNAFRRWRLAQSFRLPVGSLEVFASVMLFAGIFSYLFVMFGALIIVGISIGGILIHLNVKDTIHEMLPIIVLGTLAFILLLLTSIA